MIKNLHSFPHYTLRIFITAFAIALAPFSLFSQDWNNCGGNSSKNGLSPIVGPDGPVILWQGSQSSLFGNPVLIEGNKLVTMRFVSLTDAPVVCHDLYSGQVLWTADVTNGTGRSVPIGIRDGKVYVMRYLESQDGDSLIALDASTGERIWVAEQLIRPSLTEGCVFASNGDLLVEGNFSLVRINAADGSTMWSTPVYPWVVGWLCPTIFENTVYVQQNGIESLVALDINTGAIKYTHTVEPIGGNGQTPFMVGSDGIIYMQTTGSGGQVTALVDNGDSLSVLWTTPAGGYTVFSYMAESPDSTIYVPANYKILRLLKTTGAVIDSTDVLGLQYAFIARTSVGSDGKVYIATENTFLCATPNLAPVFIETIPNLNTSGCSLGPKNTLAVAGSGTELRVYKTSITSVNENTISEEQKVLFFPNPVKDNLFIQCSEKIKSVECMDYLGKSRQIVLENNSINTSLLSTGFYFLNIKTETGKTITGNFVKE